MNTNDVNDEGPQTGQGTSDSPAPASFGAPIHTGSGDINQAGRDIHVHLPPPSGLPVPQQLPLAVTHTLPSEAVAFTGRQAELDQLIQAIPEVEDAIGTVRVAAIDGMAGVGKRHSPYTPQSTSPPDFPADSCSCG